MCAHVCIADNFILQFINKYIKGMKQSYDKFCTKIMTTNIDGINKALINMGYKSIKTEVFQISTLVVDQKSRKTPFINNKQPFDNRENIYLRVIDLMKSFIRFEEKNFLQYAYKQSNIQHILNKIQKYRLHSKEFQLIFYLFKNNNRKQISLYLKLRHQIYNRCGHNSTKYSPISLHNQHKNFVSENVEIGGLKVDYMFWGMLAEMTKSKISEDMIWWISQGNRNVPAISFIQACIWSHQYNDQNPQSA